MNSPTPPPRIPRRTVVARDFPESRRSSRPPLSAEERPVPRSTAGVVSIAGPEALDDDLPRCSAQHCARHLPEPFGERLVRPDERQLLARAIRPAHAITPVGYGLESHGPVAS
jgi:hypothetical protein